MTLADIEPGNLFAVRFFWMKIECVIVVVSYLMGSIPFGYLVAKSRGVDIRAQGSGNIGATNVMRVLGKGPGYTVFALDTLKGLLAVVVGKSIAAHHTDIVSMTSHVGESIYRSTHIVTLPAAVAAITAAIVCIIGHNFPVWLGFKGGKGMATSAGVLIGMMPMVAIGCMAVWVVMFFATRYVSLASIAAAIALPVWTMIFLLVGLMSGWPYFYFAVVACALAVWRHRSNIVRLANGTENRFVKKAKVEEAPPE